MLQELVFQGDMPLSLKQLVQGQVNMAGDRKNQLSFQIFFPVILAGYGFAFFSSFILCLRYHCYANTKLC